MKLRHILIAGLILLPALSLGAQDMSSSDTLAYVMTDSLVYTPTANVDSSLVGKTIYDVLPSRTHGAVSGVSIHQSPEVEAGFRRHLASNKSQKLSGYRVRIFFDNRQDARIQSERTLGYFRSRYPGIPAYRSYSNPFFKVTVGDFRTRSEAMQLLERVISDFPSAFVVKETIQFPTADRGNAYTVDTLRVRKYILPR